MALSVGDPVKNLETSELKELVALIPKTMSTIPPANRARKMTLFIPRSSGLGGMLNSIVGWSVDYRSKGARLRLTQAGLQKLRYDPPAFLSPPLQFLA